MCSSDLASQYIENVSMNSWLHGQYQTATVQYNLGKTGTLNNGKSDDSHMDLDA